MKSAFSAAPLLPTALALGPRLLAVHSEPAAVGQVVVKAIRARVQ